MKKNLALMVFASLLMQGLAFGQTGTATVPATDDWVGKIKDEGMNRSQAMATIRYMTDVIGPRLTNSPGQKRANEWTKQQLEKWGLKNGAVDPWGEFGRGWEIKNFSASITAGGQTSPFRSYPKAWSPSTPGPVTADVIYVDATDEAGLEKYKGKLKGAIVLTAPERGIQDIFKPTAQRQSDEALQKMEEAKPQAGPQQGPQFQPNPQQQAAMQLAQRKNRMYFEEGAAVLIDSGNGVDAGAIRVMGASLPPSAPGSQPNFGLRTASKDAPATIPQLVAEVEQYNRLVRLVKQGVPVKMTVDLQVNWTDQDLQGYNTIAEIPGSDPKLKDEVVMVGAHLDSWHGGTGATDNGAGSTVAMEAVRIIQAAGLKPRRTIRIGLWTGEEQGLLGSRGYVTKNFAQRGDGTTRPGPGQANLPLTLKPAHEKFAAYYNLDNGTGQIRGIYLQGNEQLRSIFKGWLEPFKEWNATTVTINNTGGTDHLAFDAVGLPGFQFIQDPIEYSTRTWHTTQDVSDRILEEDLKRSAVIMATFAYNTAMMDERLPRKPSAQPGGFAALFTGLDVRAMIEDVRFAGSELDFSICGREIDAHELPQGFPSMYAIKPMDHDHAE
jgi:carboxypeptidase Q